MDYTCGSPGALHVVISIDLIPFAFHPVFRKPNTRNEATRQRRVLAARGRARVAIDEAVIRHRVGHTIPPGDNLTEEVMHVLRSRRRLQGVNNTRDGDDDGESLPLCEEGGGDDGAHAGRAAHDRMQPQRQVEAGQQAVERKRPPSSNVARGGAIPSKPEAPYRPRSRERQRNRRLSASDAGKTVVVLASVPRVNREARSSRPALLGSPSKEAVKVLPDKAGLPWPLGRRCW